MLDSKFFFTLIGLIVAVFAICNTNMSPAINEGYWGNPARTVRVVREIIPPGPDGKAGPGGYSLQNNYQSMLGHQKFVSYPNFQGNLSPRFMSGSYGPNISYNMPSYRNQGVPCDSLAIADMAKECYSTKSNGSGRGGGSRENYDGCSAGRCGDGCGAGCGVAKCGKGGISLGGLASNKPTAISHDPNFTSAMNQIRDSEYNTEVLSDGLVPVGDMTTINSLGEVEQPLIYDRFIYANAKSNLYAQGDPIRGDLPIVPCSGNWFSVHPTPNIDLNPGALNVMGGHDNGTAQAMAALINATSGGYDTTIGGVDLNMSNSFETSLSGANGDIIVSSFA